MYLGVTGTYTPPIAKVVTVSPGATPDVSGDYVEDGMYNGYMSYKRKDGNAIIWSWNNGNYMVSLPEDKNIGLNMFYINPDGGGPNGYYSGANGSFHGAVTVHDYPYTPPADACEGSPVAGTVCADGTIYVTATLRTTPNDAGKYAWVNCGGTGGPNGDGCFDDGWNWIGPATSGATDGADGRNNITTLKALSADLFTYPAAQACNNLTSNGHHDWYLPSSGELNDLYTNNGAIGNFDISGDWPGSFYWSSTELDNDGIAWTQFFSVGTQHYLITGLTVSVRCVRRYQ